MTNACLMLLGLAGSAHALEDASINPTITAFNAHSVFDIPSLDHSQRQRLLRGDVVRLINPVSDQSYQVVGLMVVPLPKRQVWIAGQDPHFASTAAVEHRLRGSGDTATWYGFLPLPMGFSDRHWVVDVWNNHDLASVTDNRMWEHPWRLHEGGLDEARPFIEQGAVGDLTVSDFDRAIFTPSNEGALAFVATGPQETLLIYHATSSVGGNIPERLMAEFARATLEGYIQKIAKNAHEVVLGHYTGDHPRLLGGDGQPIPLY
jgi:hypothetical protein